MNLPLPTLLTFALYLVAMLALGFAAYRMTNNLSDYVLGGRSLGPGVAALSAGASDMSGWLLLGLPGAVYASGLSELWIGVGLTAGAFLNWRYIAARLRRYTALAKDSLTIPDFLENRFGDNSHMLRTISAIVILIFFTLYISAGLVGGGLLFQSSFGMDYTTALIVGAIVIVSYTFLGGFLAVSWTDFFQGILMFLTLLVVPMFVVVLIGGWGTVQSEVNAVDSSNSALFQGMTVLGMLSLLSWGLGYFGQPHILARFMAMRSEADVPRATLIGMSWMILALIGSVATGYMGIAYFSGTPLENSETVLIELIRALFNPWVAGVLMAAILAAIMSTIDSQLLVSASALTNDFYKGMIRPNATDAELVWISRGAVAGVSIFALLLALDPEAGVLDLVSYAWGGFGAAFGPIVILSLYWPRMTRNGALAGMIVGAATVIIWKQLSGGLFDYYELLPGFIFAGAAVVAASLMDKQPSDRIAGEFEASLKPGS
ncbi:sodium/proline symporter PutP [Spiribacter vilamensis]|uniref:Sodium/proline symporter n=1 Tax=Spiribacter vilamensis TaxID=531306 RepID=A0A4Q8CZF4_9GAMM|nr:sodium/proline symporter PutP [Spiribacter vilamensis]RZU98399.1 sodium/proline symporter [Spiribacter vilamensis]TVO60721.1 sodium/proline symporter PutP [Spiribacter vilamensis]